jgi:hypothetical protein
MHAIDTFPADLRPWATLAHRALGWRIVTADKGVETHKVHTLFYSPGLDEMIHVEPGHQNALVWAPHEVETALRELEARLSYDARLAYSLLLVKVVGVDPQDPAAAATYVSIPPELRREALLRLVKTLH